MKRYPKLYEQIKKFKYYVATQVFFIPEADIDSFVEKCTRDRYADACKLIRSCKFTEAEIMDMYPLEEVVA